MTLWFTMGTAAELIKMYPIIDRAQARNLDWYLWCTGQGATNFWNQYRDFQLPENRAFCLDDKAQDLKSSGQAMAWFFRSLIQGPNKIRKQIQQRLKKHPVSGDFLFVHGDTFSTLIGAIYGSRLGCKIVHIEAGMRSGSIWSPFPEELNRRIVSRLTQFHFAPDDNAAKHLTLERQRGQIYITGGNSVYDALFTTLTKPRPSDLPSGRYVVANLHRFENLHSAERWEKIVETAIAAARIDPVYFVMHPPTEAKLEHESASKHRLLDAKVHLLGRQSYTRFVHLLAGASYVLTDGGSNQTECAYLGIPCLILRDKTELPEGLGQNCILSEFKQERIQEFLKNPDRYRINKTQLEKSPSEIVFDKLPVAWSN